MLRTPASLSGYPSSTWAGLPATASVPGQIIRVTDFGVAGVGLLVISDGTRWTPLGPQVLARSGVAATVTGTTAETALATVTVPAGMLGVQGSLRIWTVWSCANNANTKTPRVRFGGIGGAVYANPALTTSNSYHDLRRIRNRNSASSQVGSLGAASGASFTSAGLTLPTSALDTAGASQDIVISGQLAVGTDTLTLEEMTVEVTP